MENIRKEKEEFYDNKHYLREIEVISGVSMKNIYSIIETKYNKINEKIENKQPCELYVDEYAKVDYFSPSNKQVVKYIISLNQHLRWNFKIIKKLYV